MVGGAEGFDRAGRVDESTAQLIKSEVDMNSFRDIARWLVLGRAGGGPRRVLRRAWPWLLW